MVIASGGESSNLSKSNFPMYDPFQYESGYKYYITSNTGYYENLYFRTDKNFRDVNKACGPIAATNIMIYWKNRSYSTCKNFMRGDGTWRKTFDELRSTMHFFDDTYIGLFAVGTELFMDLHSTTGFTVSWSAPSSNGWQTVVNEIGSKGYPIVLLLQNHLLYGNHYVIAFKYVSFAYNDGSFSNYVQICDGWSMKADRYINFTKGFKSGSIYTVTIRPN